MIRFSILARTEAEFLEEAKKHPMKAVEFNFAANVILMTEMALTPKMNEIGPFQTSDRRGKALLLCVEEAEKQMLQTALLNDGHIVSTAFINVAYGYGWRYRIDKGYHRAPMAEYRKLSLATELRRRLAFLLWK